MGTGSLRQAEKSAQRQVQNPTSHLGPQVQGLSSCPSPTSPVAHWCMRDYFQGFLNAFVSEKILQPPSGSHGGTCLGVSQCLASCFQNQCMPGPHPRIGHCRFRSVYQMAACSLRSSVFTSPPRHRGDRAGQLLLHHQHYQPVSVSCCGLRWRASHLLGIQGRASPTQC